MARRLFSVLAALVALVWLAPVPVGGQGRTGAPTPRAADGHPDLSGYWTNATFTPLERPEEFAGREFLTEAEAIAYQKKKELQENSQSKDDIHYDNVLWQSESYVKDVSARRTSLIYDPADGKIPPLTAAARERQVAEAAAARRRDAAAGAEARNLQERCISWGNEGPPMLGATYYNNLQIFQTGKSVVIRHELMHGVRIVPTDDTPRPNVRMLNGNGRGRWEGDTLVIDTKHFTNRTPFRGPPASSRQDIFSSDQLHVIERFTRISPTAVRYQFTIDDPGTWVRPWSGEIVMRKWEGPIFEYACHEGNYGLAFILSAARAAEGATDQVLGTRVR